MTIAIKCPNCSTKIKAPDSMAGRKGKCPKCKSAVTIKATDIDSALGGEAIGANAGSRLPTTKEPPGWSQSAPVTVPSVSMPNPHPIATVAAPEHDSDPRRDGGDMAFKCPFCGTDSLPVSVTKVLPTGWWIFLVPAIGTCGFGFLFSWIALLIFREQFKKCSQCDIKLG